MIEQKVIITCDECGSEDVSERKEQYNHQYRRVKDCDNLMEWTELKSVDEYLICHCNNCGNDFEEKLGTRTFDLLPDQIEI